MGQERWCPLGFGTLGVETQQRQWQAHPSWVLEGITGPQTLMASTPHTCRQLVPWRGFYEAADFMAGVAGHTDLLL